MLILLRLLKILLDMKGNLGYGGFCLATVRHLQPVKSSGGRPLAAPEQLEVEGNSPANLPTQTIRSAMTGKLCLMRM